MQAAECAMQEKYGDASLCGRNNQFRLILPGKQQVVVVKTGSKGQVMQRTYGSEIGSRFTGTSDADIVVVAVRNRPNDPIRVYEVPGDVYRERITTAYAALVQSGQLNPTDLRVLRLDGKGYPIQRVDEEWEKYLLTEQYVLIADVLSSPTRETRSGNTAKVVEEAKAMVAEAFGVPIEKVSISVNM